MGGRRRSLCRVCWRRWPERKNGLMTSLLYELGGVQSSRVGGRRRSSCRECWRRWPGRKKRFSGLIKERLNITSSFPKFFLALLKKESNMLFYGRVLVVLELVVTFLN